MKNRIIILIIFFTISINAQEQIDNYYPVSTTLKETGKLDKNGFPTDTWKYYTKKGTLDYEINWNINYVKRYYTTGELKEEGTFIPETGVHIGTWVTYCKNEEIDNKIEYDENGIELKK